MIPTKLTKENLSIATIWLFHVSGILGMLYGNSDWFISATPLNLLISFVLLLLNSKGHKWFFPMTVIAFLVGMISEILGVQFGWIFGNYQYGEQLGYYVAGSSIDDWSQLGNAYDHNRGDSPPVLRKHIHANYYRSWSHASFRSFDRTSSTTPRFLGF